MCLCLAASPASVAARPNFVIEPYSKQRLSDLAAVDLVGDTGGALVLIFSGDGGGGSGGGGAIRWSLLAANASIRQAMLTALQSAWRAVLMDDLPVRQVAP